MIQALGLVDYDPARIAPGLVGKVRSLLLRDQDHVIGEQLYFFVLLFGISSLFVLLLEISRSSWVLVWIAGVLLVGMGGLMIARPLPLQATGMSLEVWVGGCFSMCWDSWSGEAGTRWRDGNGWWERALEWRCCWL